MAQTNTVENKNKITWPEFMLPPINLWNVWKLKTPPAVSKQESNK